MPRIHDSKAQFRVSECVASFRGIVIAPSARLTVSSKSHQARFFAKKLRVEAGAKIVPPSLFEENSECEPDKPPKLPDLELADLGPAPGLADADDLDAFLDWYFKIRIGEVPAAKDAISAVGANSDIVGALVERFNQARDAGKVGSGLMILSLLGSMSSAAAETFLSNVATETIPDLPENELSYMSKVSDLDRELAFRMKAVTVLASRATSSAQDVVHDLATDGGHEQLRAHAIRILARHMSSEEKDDLRAQLIAGDVKYVDQPHRLDSDFQEAVNTYVANYVQSEGN